MVYKKECCGRCTCAALASPLDLDAWVTLRFLLVCFGLVFPFSFFIFPVFFLRFLSFCNLFLLLNLSR